MARAIYTHRLVRERSRFYRVRITNKNMNETGYIGPDGVTNENKFAKRNRCYYSVRSTAICHLPTALILCRVNFGRPHAIVAPRNQHCDVQKETASLKIIQFCYSNC